MRGSKKLKLKFQNNSWSELSGNQLIMFFIWPFYLIAFIIIILYFLPGILANGSLIIFLPPILIIFSFMLMFYPFKQVQFMIAQDDFSLSTQNILIPIPVTFDVSLEEILHITFIKSKNTIILKHPSIAGIRKVSLNGIEKQQFKQLLNFLKDHKRIKLTTIK